VAVTHALAATKEARGSVPNLLSAPIPLKPDESRTVDVSDELSKLFNPLDKARQEKRIRIRLALEPEPPQPQRASQYSVTFQEGQFTEFSAP